MHVENLKVFCDLVDSKSFSQAARINNITQSAVSQQLRAMEKHFDGLIIDRSQKQFRLTNEGEKVLQFAREMLGQYEILQCELQAMKKVLSGTIQVSTVCSIGLHELPPYLKQFLQAHPTIKVNVEYRRSNLVYEDVLQRKADIGLVAFPSNENAVETIPFVEDELILISSREHPLSKQESIGLEALLEQRFIGFDQDIPTRQATDKIFKEIKLGVRPVMEFDNVETVKRAVEIDAGIALVPEGTVRQDIEKGNIRKLNVDKTLSEKWRRPLAIIYRKNRTLTPALEKFIQLLTKSPSETTELNAEQPGLVETN